MSAAHHRGPVGTVSSCLLLLLLAFTLPLRVAAGTFPNVEISEEAGNYRIRMTALIRAPAQSVHEVLTDYRHIYRLNPAITQSAILASPHDGTVRVKTRVEGCILFFCRDVDRVEEVRELDAGHLQAVIVPEYSDFTAGSADWRIQPLGNDSRIVYEARVTPAFFIPPVIGSYFVKRAFGEAVLTSFEKLECVARIRAGMDVPAPSYRVDATSGPMQLETMRRELLAGNDPTTHGAPPAAGADGSPPTLGCARACDESGGGC
jgi:hypothetical protein